MRVFLSWSGDMSKGLARIFSNWLPNVIQSIEPFYSPEMDKGCRWSNVIGKELDAHDFGLFFLTPENLTAPWVLFEAGALSKKFDDSRVCCILFDLKASDIVGPLAQFQLTKFERDDVLKLLQTINKHLPERAQLQDAKLKVSFDKWWVDLEKEVSDFTASLPQSVTPPKRAVEDVMEETLTSVRSIYGRQSQMMRKILDIYQTLSIPSTDKNPLSDNKPAKRKPSGKEAEFVNIVLEELNRGLLDDEDDS